MPPAVAHPADVYIHAVEGRAPPQVWLRAEPPAWVEVREGHPHPTLEGYFLLLLLKGEPRWVQGKSYKAYCRRVRKVGGLPPELEAGASGPA